MEAFVHWCPHCEEGVEALFPACGYSSEPTPLYTYVNAVAQFLPGVPTYIEFKLVNVAGEPVLIEAFHVAVGPRVLGPGIHELDFGVPLPPGEHLIDRRVDLGIHDVTPGEFQLRVEVVFACGEGRFRMAGTTPVYFTRPGAASLPYYDPRTEAKGFLSATQPPPVPGLAGLPFGETEALLRETSFVRSMKGQYGFAFLPLRMRYTEESAAPRAVLETHCAECGAGLVEGGGYCHACGRAVTIPANVPLVAEGEARAWCYHCDEGGALRGRHRYCPLCGEVLPLHIALRSVGKYMQSVEKSAQLRLHAPHAEPVEVTQLEVFLGAGDGAVPCAVHDAGALCLDAARARRQVGVGVCCPRDEPVGERRLTVRAEFAHDGRVYRVEGAREVRVLPADADKQTIINNFGAQSIDANDAAVSAGSWNINIADRPNENKLAHFIEELLEKEWQDSTFEPLRLRLIEVRELPREAPRPEAPAAPPPGRVSLRFDLNGLTHNYCIKPTETADFGRSPDRDFYLLEVETCLAHMKAQHDAGQAKPQSGSQVSRNQWRVTLAREGVQVENLSDHNLTMLHPAGSTLLPRQTAPVAPGGWWDLLGNPPDVIGLALHRLEPDFDGRPALFERARALCAEAVHGPGVETKHQPFHGAAVLTRRHSLHGAYEGTPPEYGGFEAYVLLPGWVSVGNSPGACIRIAHASVAARHAWLFQVGGFYFVAPTGADTPVRVNGSVVTTPWPAPIEVGDNVVFGDLSCSFEPYRGLHM